MTDWDAQKEQAGVSNLSVLCYEPVSSLNYFELFVHFQLATLIAAS